MSRFMLLIYSDAKAWEAVPEAETHEVMGEYFAYTQELAQAGALLAGDPLHPVSTARTVAADGVVTDGPFAEMNEVLGGYYIVEVDSQDEACAWAAKLPGVGRGLDRIEVREVQELPPGMMPG